MPGASVELIGAEKVRRRLDKLVRAGQDAAPLMRDIGEHVLTSTRDRFDSQTAPDGTPWEPLSDDTKRRKKRNKDKILTLDGDLRGNLAYRAGRDSVEIGSPSVYAGTHQFGALHGAFGATSRNGPIPWGDIPERPFLGLSDADRAEIEELAIVRDTDRFTIAEDFARLFPWPKLQRDDLPTARIPSEPASPPNLAPSDRLRKSLESVIPALMDIRKRRRRSVSALCRA